ncbi:hypothetical protein BCR33DRAFT_793110 [Rhizoclosmatium globosum]|uniref:Uncharacterized protein n=1 Tax=Rhizoclosmatium globosum TaxID=329046 RepID=A0A1Y2B5B2_9FUNG|nr:hypothetical protein BCR33DRAFT_793110 [Rhizoclosmatium globosum]|eukprot:ORY29285.1 hypothetical protein BCR33DRAFT_793110 [Rhizoclosmatium globosum]
MDDAEDSRNVRLEIGILDGAADVVEVDPFVAAVDSLDMGVVLPVLALVRGLVWCGDGAYSVVMKTGVEVEGHEDNILEVVVDKVDRDSWVLEEQRKAVVVQVENHRGEVDTDQEGTHVDEEHIESSVVIAVDSVHNHHRRNLGVEVVGVADKVHSLNDGDLNVAENTVNDLANKRAALETFDTGLTAVRVPEYAKLCVEDTAEVMDNATYKLNAVELDDAVMDTEELGGLIDVCVAEVLEVVERIGEGSAENCKVVLGEEESSGNGGIE